MKKRYLALLIAISILILSFVKNKNVTGGSPRLPVYISYKYNTRVIPDSIRNAINFYLKAKKIKVLDQDQLMALIVAEMNSTLTSLINSGGINDRTAKNIGDKLDPVGNIVAVQVFNSQQSEDMFIIDSIYWRVKAVPFKDSAWMHKEMFVPDSTAKLSTNATLKSFVDKVVSSGYLF